MKKKLKKVLFPIFLSVLCGAICGRLVYSIYEEKLDDQINGKKIYLIQSGEYDSYDNMVKETLLSNYVYYEDDGMYKSIIGITEDYDNIEKIKNTYGDDVIVNEYYSKDMELNDKIEYYDKEIKKITDDDKIKELVIDMLEFYKGRNTTLIQMES